MLSHYVVDDLVTGSGGRVKLATLQHRLLGGSQHAAAILVSADDRRGGRAAVDRFAAALGDPAMLAARIAAGR